MQEDKIEKYLEDIIICLTNVESSTAGLEAKHYNNYEVSWIVERGIEIIAEALKRMIAIDPETKISNIQKIIGTRNKITHEYDVVDSYQLYVIVVKYLPVLRTEVQAMLDSKQQQF